MTRVRNLDLQIERNDDEDPSNPQKAKRLFPNLTRYPFTTAATLLLLGFAVSSQSIWQPLDVSWREWLGFAPTNLLDFQWQRLLTSLFLTAGSWKFLASLVMLTVCVGLAECCYGTLATMKLFLTTHLLVLITISVIVVLLATCISSPAFLALAKGRDIGPSAGYYGCLGALLLSLPSTTKRVVFLFVWSILLVRLAVSMTNLPEDAAVVSADIAHLLALPLGGFLTWCGYMTPSDASHPRSVAHSNQSPPNAETGISETGISETGGTENARAEDSSAGGKNKR
jgi:membrane associated rhomboid family serine protease